MEYKDARNKTIARTSWISMVGNGLLSAAKIVIGLISGSVAVLGDGIDSATDVVISIVMVFTARIMRRPPDKKYAYGYEKAESIATKILSLVIFYAGVQILVSSIQRIFSSETTEMPGMMAIYITLVSIAGKLGLSVFQFRQGKKINSSMLIANAKNMRNDVVISGSVLAGLFFGYVLDAPVLDSVAGLVVSIFIIRSSITVFLDSNVELMDGVKDVSVYKKIFEAVDKVPGAGNAHRVRSRQVGNLYVIALDIEADGTISLNEAHKIAEEVEARIKESVEDVYDIVVHVEPEGASRSDEKFGIDKMMI